MRSAPPAGVATLTAHAPTTAELTPWVRRFVRIGYAAKGTIYLLIGGLALRLALGDGGRLTDSSGVLKTIADLPLGIPLLAVIGVGLLAYAGWEITEGAFDTKRKGSDPKAWLSRGLTIIKAFVYGAIGIKAVRVAFGDRSASGNPDSYAQTAMQFPLGGIAFGLVGLGIALYGARQIWAAWQGRLDSDLDYRQLRQEGALRFLAIGRAGVGARGLILMLMGLTIARAGFLDNPSEAGGTTEALWTVFTQPYGQWLLAAVAAGLICYGAFQLMHARYARL